MTDPATAVCILGQVSKLRPIMALGSLLMTTIYLISIITRID